MTNDLGSPLRHRRWRCRREIVARRSSLTHFIEGLESVRSWAGDGKCRHRTHQRLFTVGNSSKYDEFWKWKRNREELQLCN